MHQQAIDYITKNPNAKISYWFDAGEYGCEVESSTGSHLVTGTGDSAETATRSALVQVGFIQS
jgi:hypothetical protein